MPCTKISTSYLYYHPSLSWQNTPARSTDQRLIILRNECKMVAWITCLSCVSQCVQSVCPLLVCIAWLDEAIALAGDNDMVKATANGYNMLMNDMALSCGVK